MACKQRRDISRRAYVPFGIRENIVKRHKIKWYAKIVYKHVLQKGINNTWYHFHILNPNYKQTEDIISEY
ncbi:hypothetical protein B7C51_22655 [Paenibacillus larvae subsp. pulvifaciens]|uniref:Transposase n=1 Tax=Paenibacillus larvae subsp. pulvifaciens TaxID=1477 RepID=A0A1V0UYD5_9BACL|nr:hypothetical protein B7C51_22655 [Paenibacillus larvae subsp. pulvifaciens]